MATVCKALGIDHTKNFMARGGRPMAKVAKELGLVVVFDNTFASPALQNPLDLGVDVVIHSTTKYISGHSDVIGGAVRLSRRASVGTSLRAFLCSAPTCRQSTGLLDPRC